MYCLCIMILVYDRECCLFFFFFSSRRRHTRLQGDWSSDVCSSDLLVVTVADGRLTSVTGNPDHPFTQGVICGKVREYAERVHSPLRVRRPLRRVGPKGAGEFAPISWDDAIGTIADRWRAIMATDGAEAILPFSYAGSMGQIQYFAGHPLFHA